MLIDMIYYITRQREFAHAIKVTDQLILTQRVILDYLGELNLINKILKTETFLWLVAEGKVREI